MAFEDDRYLNIRELSARYGYTPGGLYKRIARGEFPPGVFIGRFRRWLKSEIEAWEHENFPRAGGPSPREGAQD